MSAPRVVRGLREVPRDLPIFGALTCGGGVLAFGYADLFGKLVFGRPSSTWAIGLMMATFESSVAAVAGLIAGLVGFVIWQAAMRRHNAKPRETRWLLIVLNTVIGGALLFGLSGVFLLEAKAKPAVLVDTGALSKSAVPPSGRMLGSGSLVYTYDKGEKPFSWRGKMLELSFARDGGVAVGDPLMSRKATVSTEGLDYVDYIYAAPAHFSSAPGDVLAVVIDGRATGERAMIAVIDSSFHLLYEERVKVCWRIKDNPLQTRSHASSGPYEIVVGPTCTKPMVLTPRR